MIYITKMNSLLLIVCLFYLTQVCYGYLSPSLQGITSTRVKSPMIIRKNIRLFESSSENDISTTLLSPRIEIEYCPGCRWMLRSSWLSQELLMTFEKNIGEIALIPSKKTGTFKVRVDGKQIWDRTDEKTKGFPEIKQLKQLVRDIIAPDLHLGHSDKK